jgi:hypothetical protein
MIGVLLKILLLYFLFLFVRGFIKAIWTAKAIKNEMKRRNVFDDSYDGDGQGTNQRVGDPRNKDAIEAEYRVIKD